MKHSIVIRGSICFDKHENNYIEAVVENIRNWHDGEVILSTWIDQVEQIPKNLKIDTLVLCEDPGPGPVQHFKRQALSFKNGVDKCSGEIITVIRSDIILKKNPINFLREYSKKTNILNIFEKKIIVSNMMTINPDGNEFPNIFRICDWIHCGFEPDIKKFGNVLDYINKFEIENKVCTEINWSLANIQKIYPEINYNNFENFHYFRWQYILNNFIIKNFKTSLDGENLNWPNQPEFLDCYLSEKMYNDKYKEIFENNL
jgi:hypothetical protein